MWWVLFVLVSAGLFAGYYIDGTHPHEEADPLMKGLSTVQHFGVHFVAGIFFALLILVFYKIITKRRLNKPLVLLICVLWAHWPDIRYSYLKLPHQPWENIFFFHNIVDGSYLFFWAFFVIDIALLFIYRRLKNN